VNFITIFTKLIAFLWFFIQLSKGWIKKTGFLLQKNWFYEASGNLVKT